MWVMTHCASSRQRWRHSRRTQWSDEWTLSARRCAPNRRRWKRRTFEMYSESTVTSLPSRLLLSRYPHPSWCNIVVFDRLWLAFSEWSCQPCATLLRLHSHSSQQTALWSHWLAKPPHSRVTRWKRCRCDNDFRSSCARTCRQASVDYCSTDVTRRVRLDGRWRHAQKCG